MRVSSRLRQTVVLQSSSARYGLGTEVWIGVQTEV